MFVSGFPNKSSPPSSPPTVPKINFGLALPVIVSIDPSNIKLASAFAAFDVPSDVSTLLSAAFAMVVNPVPLVPLLPAVPD